MPVPSGAIQGSAIGGTLFSLFINNLSAVIKYCQKWLFIDDLNFVGDASTREVCTLIQLDLDSIYEGSEKYFMPLSFRKYVEFVLKPVLIASQL